MNVIQMKWNPYEMSGIVQISSLIWLLLLVGCSQSEALSTSHSPELDKIESYTICPKSEKIEPQVIPFGDSIVSIDEDFMGYCVNNCEYDSICVYVRNYSLTRTVNNGTQKLLVHRTHIDNQKAQVELKDVNYFVDHLNELTVLLLTEYRDRFEGDIGDLGTMYFIDSLHANENSCDSVDYEMSMSYFSGGGTTTEMNERIRVSREEYRKIADMGIDEVVRYIVNRTL